MDFEDLVTAVAPPPNRVGKEAFASTHSSFLDVKTSLRVKVSHADNDFVKISPELRRYLKLNYVLFKVTAGGIH